MAAAVRIASVMLRLGDDEIRTYTAAALLIAYPRYFLAPSALQNTR